MTNLRFFEKLDFVDNLINSADHTSFSGAFKQISDHLDDQFICQYFLEKIDSEQWAEAILNSDFIKEAKSKKIPSLKNNQFDWLFLGYILKIADRVPELASSYLKSIISIDDELLHERIIEVMLKLPCDTSANLVKSEIKWLQSKDELYSLYPEFVGKLILHIQDCNESIAFEFIREIIKVDAVIRESGTPGSETYYKSIDIKARYSDWEYQSVLNKYIRTFILNSDNSLQYLELLFDHMSTVLHLERVDPENDYSWVWRNTFEDNEQTRHISGIKEHLLVFLRDLSISLIKEDMINFQRIIHSLEKHKWTVLKRLSMYMSVKFPEINLDITEKLISNTTLYESSRTRNEYSLLLDSAFNLVSEDVQNKVYTWIDEEVDIEHYIQRYNAHNGVIPSEEKINDYKDHWKKTRLYLIRNHLKGEKLTEYQALIKEQGEPNHPEYSSYTTSWVGPTSPMTVNEIKELKVSDLILKLKEWKPSGKSMAPSPEGLSRNLSEAIKTNTNKYKYSASLFKNLPPTYIDGVFQGFRDNLTCLDPDSWPSIIDLSEWVLSQKDDTRTEQGINSDKDLRWAWCRKTIASLINSGLKKGQGQIPIELKDRVWDVILILTQDPDPTPTHEAEYGGNNMEPATLAINTVRGEAMHALIEYGLWVGRNTLDKKISFVDIPEVREVLDHHLNPKLDPSLAIRSVYGRFYPWLNLLDTKWARDARTKIFSDDKLGLGITAWDTYISFCQPYDDTFAIIPDVYLKYVRKLSDINNSDDRNRSFEHLTGHIITFYWRSKLDLHDEIIQAYYIYAPLNIRKHAIEFIGRSLGKTPGDLDKSIEDRLKALYEWRQAETEKSGEHKELEGFCWWVDANIIDSQWVLTKFHELLKVLDKVDSLDFAARKLGSYLDVNPSMVLECMDMMLDKLQVHGMYFTWNDAAQEIIREALLLEDIKDQAIELVHKFGSRGFLEYRKLLKS